MSTTVLTQPYRDAFAALRYAIDSEHAVGSAAHEKLHTCVDEFSRLIAAGIPAIENREI